MTTSHIGKALEEMETERAHLVARLAKVDALIAQTREVFHLPTAPTRGRVPRAKGTPRKVAARRIGALTSLGDTDPPPRSTRRGAWEDLVHAIRSALADGPMGPGELAAVLKIPRPRLRHYLAQLEHDGIVVATGTTISRRIALPGRPAKEVP